MVQKILIADDSPTIVEMLKFALSSEGYEVVTACDGIDAIEMVYKEAPDLILLDILMPKMNGYQVCRLIKGDKDTASIPVIMLTGQDQPKDKFWGLETGADDFIVKDFESMALFESIERILKEQKNVSSDKRLNKKETVSFDSILSRVNELLDKRLFQTTLMNLVNHIAQTEDKCDDIIREILHVLTRVVNYHAGMILLKENDESSRLTVYINQFVNDAYLHTMIEKIKQDAMQYLGYSIDKTNIHITTFNQATNIPSKDTTPPHKHKTYISLPLMAHKDVIGVIGLSSPDDNMFSGEVIDTLNVVVNESSIVINNVMLHEEIKRMAITDGLTKCYNHRHFQEIIANEFNRCKRYNSLFALILIDIDHFKSVNDVYGHRMGDSVLREVSACLKKSIRDVDFAARYGGEEFALIFPATNLIGAHQTAERIRQSIENMAFSELPPERQITISLGVSSYPEILAQTQYELIDRTDQALYRAKHSGRNKVEVAV
ncbi:MAG: diguanylate cyclase [bacterium]|nr:diguanylate cyclase [bacterium]